jgi:hypothetical protein
MQQPLPIGTRTLSTPKFHLMGRQRLSPGSILLAIVVAVGALYGVSFVLSHSGHRRFLITGSDTRKPSGGSSSSDDDDDDPSQIDTIVLSDPADAPVPGKHGDHVSPVHPTIVVRLPRYGDQVGLIPDTPAGHLLWQWLAAFNQSSASALENALPNDAPKSTVAAEMELRKHTGGFALISAKEVQPGVLVFRMCDQTPAATEVLGTLQVREDSLPARIASFSLRAVEAVK